MSSEDTEVTPQRLQFQAAHSPIAHQTPRGTSYSPIVAASSTLGKEQVHARKPPGVMDVRDLDETVTSDTKSFLDRVRAKASNHRDF